jgi:monomeric isocitrate dehydrogenase
MFAMPPMQKSKQVKDWRCLKVEISQSRWMPEIFAMFEELKSQNQYLVEKVERLEEIVDKKPLTLNTAEAAKVLGYSLEYVRKLDRDGKMPKRVSKDGQRARWNRLDIEKMAKFKKIGRPRSNS